jgi:hypothetical protein
MKVFIITLVSMTLLGLAWFLLAQAGLLPEMSLLDKEVASAWFSDKIKEIAELVGYETGQIG